MPRDLGGAKSGIGCDYSAGVLRPFFSFFALLYQRWAAVLIPVSHLALQTVVALVVNNFSGWLNGGYLALMCTGLTGFATLVASAQPVKNSKTGYKA